MPRTNRALAFVIAIVAWIGIAVQLDASAQLSQSVPRAMWIMVRYFTILTNLSVAVVFSAVALNLNVRASILGGVTISILLVGLVYATLLRGMIELSGGAKLADFLLHIATPILAPLYWVFLAQRGLLKRSDPVYWMAIPTLYLAYALVRGAYEGIYAYPFLDLPKIGAAATSAYALAMGIGFYITGWLMFRSDNWRARDRA